VFEGRVVRMFGPKRIKKQETRKLHNEELHNLYSSPDIINTIKSRRMSWAGHIAHVVQMFIETFVTKAYDRRV
jgi:hypothetical protein